MLQIFRVCLPILTARGKYGIAPEPGVWNERDDVLQYAGGDEPAHPRIRLVQLPGER